MTYYRLKIENNTWGRYLTAEEAITAAQKTANSMRYGSIEVVKVVETCSTVLEIKPAPLYKPLWKD